MVPERCCIKYVTALNFFKVCNLLSGDFYNFGINTQNGIR